LRTHKWIILSLAAAAVAQTWALQKKQRQQRPADEPERVYLVHADELFYDRWQRGDAQVLDGNVQFRHNGATLWCDSAHFYQQTNSFEAFGNVRMVQGDTLSLTADYGFYDGNEQLMKALDNVVLRNRDATLYTDSLYYDRLYNEGYYENGGRLVQQGTTLTSDWGEYHTDTKNAIFYYDVHMTDRDFTLRGDTLYYNTRLHRARIAGPTDILSGSSTIRSQRGYYHTDTKVSELMDRSVLRDGEKTLVADSIWHSETTGVSEAFGQIVYTDHANRNMLLGNYGYYADSTGYAVVTDSAVVIDYSQQDTLYMHADTLKLFTYNIRTDSVYRVAHAFRHVRAYRRDVQGVCDSLVYTSRDSCLTMYHDPIVWNMQQQLMGEKIEVFMRDSVIDRAHVVNSAFSTEKLPDSLLYNQVSSKEMYAYFDKGKIRLAEAIDNVLTVYYPLDDSDSSYVGLNHAESTKMRMYMKAGQMEAIWMPKAEGTLYPMTQIPPKERFLEGFAWYDYIRPTDRHDIFRWRGKKENTDNDKTKTL